jgi:hypothetical protein
MMAHLTYDGVVVAVSSMAVLYLTFKLYKFLDK